MDEIRSQRLQAKLAWQAVKSSFHRALVAIVILAALATALEAPAAAFQIWLKQAVQCLCLPIRQQLDFDGAREQNYPPPVYAEAEQVVEEEPPAAVTVD